VLSALLTILLLPEPVRRSFWVDRRSSSAYTTRHGPARANERRRTADPPSRLTWWYEHHGPFDRHGDVWEDVGYGQILRLMVNQNVTDALITAGKEAVWPAGVATRTVPAVPPRKWCDEVPRQYPRERDGYPVAERMQTFIAGI
jgi:hypothetical protein